MVKRSNDAAGKHRVWQLANRADGATAPNGGAAFTPASFAPSGHGGREVRPTTGHRYQI
jgi:hypothetical protein